jgi:hypothetical protein
LSSENSGLRERLHASAARLTCIRVRRRPDRREATGIRANESWIDGDPHPRHFASVTSVDRAAENRLGQKVESAKLARRSERSG